MTDNKLTAEEIFDSLTGFDELAIAEHFGRTIGDLADTDSSMFGRALVFTVKRREGVADIDARAAALSMTMKEHIAFFGDSSDEEAGKGEEPEEQPVSSLSSVS